MSEVKTMNTEKWHCVSCRFLLGYVENKKTIRIKRKDLYIEFEGGKVTVLCPRCAKKNELEDTPEKIQDITS